MTLSITFLPKASSEKNGLLKIQWIIAASGSTQLCPQKLITL